MRGATQSNTSGDEDEETATRALIRPINKRRAKYAGVRFGMRTLCTPAAVTVTLSMEREISRHFVGAYA
jgi:hypothetical protein